MIKLILANKPKYVDVLDGVLQRAIGTAELLREPNIVWFLLADESGAVGAAYAYAISDVRMYFNILLVGEHAHHKSRKQAGKDLIKYLKANSQAAKIETTIPTVDTVKMRYFSQLGFKREGIARSSIRVNGELRDQHYMGLVL